MDMPEAYSGGVIQELNRRKGMMLIMETLSTGFVRIKYEMPTRGLIGFRSFFLTETRGEGSMSGLFLGYRPFAGEFSGSSVWLHAMKRWVTMKKRSICSIPFLINTPVAKS
jgi:GTP-binding protein